MRESLLTAIASMAIVGTIMLLFPGHQVATPAYAVASRHDHLNRPPVKPDYAIPLPAGTASYGVHKMTDFAVPKGTFENANIADLRRFSRQATLHMPIRGLDIRADETVPQLAVPGDTQDTDANNSFVERADYATALAELPPGVNRTKRIALKDLDLSLPENQASLHARIRSAAKKVCGPRGFSRTEKLNIARCEADALALAMPKVERSIMRAQQTLRINTN